MTEQELINVLRVAFAGDKDKPVREWAKQLDQVKAQLAEIRQKLDQINP